jgi:hypothetical protein
MLLHISMEISVLCTSKGVNYGLLHQSAARCERPAVFVLNVTETLSYITQIARPFGAEEAPLSRRMPQKPKSPSYLTILSLSRLVQFKQQQASAYGRTVSAMPSPAIPFGRSNPCA